MSGVNFWDLVICSIALYYGWCLGVKKRGLMARQTAHLPAAFFKVVYSNKLCTVIREINSKGRTFLISTEMFSGKPVRAQMIVRVVKNLQEMEERHIDMLGFFPLIEVHSEK